MGRDNYRNEGEKREQYIKKLFDFAYGSYLWEKDDRAPELNRPRSILVRGIDYKPPETENGT